MKLASWLLRLCFAVPLAAAPVWTAPKELPFGELSVLEIREDDPAAAPLPRPGEERLGTLILRGVDPLPDGRGWKLTVQAMVPGMAIIPPMDLGDGRFSPELRVQVPRTVPYGAPWMGVGGGQGDILDYIPFPWAWGLLVVAPVLIPVWLLIRRWRRGGAKRRLRHVRRVFTHHWPPASKGRENLDAAHDAGRDLLAAHFGEAARSWGTSDFKGRQLDVWATWIQSLDAARFGRKEPPFPPLLDLLAVLEQGR